MLYIGGYGLGRLWVEMLRSDAANEILGVRVNIWTSLLAIVGAAAVLAVRGLRRRPDDTDEPYTDGHVYTEHDEHDAPSDSGDSGDSAQSTEGVTTDPSPTD